MMYIVQFSLLFFLDLHIHCSGQPGHGSLLLENTAGEKVNYILQKFHEFREGEKKKLRDNPKLTIGDVTTVNVTQIHVSNAIHKILTQLFIVIVTIKSMFANENEDIHRVSN